MSQEDSSLAPVSGAFAFAPTKNPENGKAFAQGSSPRIWYETGEPALTSFMTRQVAACRAVGMQLESEQAFIHSVTADGSEEGKRETTWTWKQAQRAEFRPDFKAETLTQAEFVERFSSEEWCVKNPHHPISHMRWMLKALQQTLAEVKAIGTSKKYVREGSIMRFALVPENATPEEEEAFLADLEELLNAPS